jgi:hypothetical protein
MVRIPCSVIKQGDYCTDMHTNNQPNDAPSNVKVITVHIRQAVTCHMSWARNGSASAEASRTLAPTHDMNPSMNSITLAHHQGQHIINI